MPTRSYATGWWRNEHYGRDAPGIRPPLRPHLADLVDGDMRCRHSADRRELLGEWNAYTNGRRRQCNRQLSKLDNHRRDLMAVLETYYIGLDELEASMMDEIAELNRSIVLLVKLRDEKMRTFQEMFCQEERDH